MDDVTTAMEESMTVEEPASTPSITPALAAQLNCGYDCSKYFYTQPNTRAYYDALTREEREAIKEEYYKSYDYMTGIRTAEFLGGAILLFSLFVLYKMKCRSGRRRKMSVVATKITSDNILTPPELTSSPDIILSEPINEKDSGCRNGSASISSSRRGSTRFDMVKPFHLTRFNAGRLSCGNINGPSSLLWTETLLRPSSVQCMSLGLQQQPPSPFYCRPVHLRTSEQSNELIDIQIIQPTPNASPRGSTRRLSEDSGSHLCSPHLSPSTLSIPKSQSCLQAVLNSGFVATGRTSRGKPVKPRRLSLSPGDCYLTSSRPQNVELIGNCSYRVIPNSPSTPTFGGRRRVSCAASGATSTASSSTPIALLDPSPLGPSVLGKRRLSSRSVVDEVDVHRSPDVRRASTACHVSWLPVTSRQATTGLPLDVNCVLLESDDTKISETRC